MNVNTYFGAFGPYLKTQHPDGSITLADQDAGEYVEILKSDLPLSREAVEARFIEKYPHRGQENAS